MTNQNYGLIIKRHPDGFHYVPLDADLAPEHRAAYTDHLLQTGHQVEKMPDGHLKLLSGPHAAKA